TDDCKIASVAIELHPKARHTGLSDKLVKKAIASMKQLKIFSAKVSYNSNYIRLKKNGAGSPRRFGGPRSFDQPISYYIYNFGNVKKFCLPLNNL
ncbi:MAG: hypothetical protein J5631_06980, partial [Spirochaetaceae bacterium]|nr:hypothetical protein [Spirochaetaceae bacterium]